MIVLFFISFLLLCLGIGFIVFLIKQKRQFGILNNDRIYQDSKSFPGVTLIAKTIPLAGKPDYIIRKADMIIPVEVKSGKTPSEPYLHHTMQLMAYCFLIEETYGIRPKGGVLKYISDEKEFYLAYTDEAKQSVQDLVEEILNAKKQHIEFSCNHKNHNLQEVLPFANKLS